MSHTNQILLRNWNCCYIAFLIISIQEQGLILRSVPSFPVGKASVYSLLLLQKYMVYLPLLEVNPTGNTRTDKTWGPWKGRTWDCGQVSERLTLGFHSGTPQRRNENWLESSVSLSDIYM